MTWRAGGKTIGTSMVKTDIEGVYSKGRKFIALIYVRGEHRFLGAYSEKEKAAAKVAKMAMVHEGEWCG
jgi:hypothetical protein